MAVHDHEHGNGGFFSSRANIALIVFIAIGAFYLVTEHRAHFLGWFPFLLVLICPLTHMFMHGGHQGHDRGDRRGESGQ
jgi:hypothetical protein